MSLSTVTGSMAVVTAALQARRDVSWIALPWRRSRRRPLAATDRARGSR